MKRWPLHKAWFWEKVPFFRLLLPFMAGIALYPLWKGSNAASLITAVFAYLLFLATALYKTDAVAKTAARFLSLHAFFIFTAFSLCYYDDARNVKTWYGHTADTADLYLLRVTERPAEREQSWKLKAEVLEAVSAGAGKATSGHAFVYLYKDKTLPLINKGDTLLVPNKWRSIKNAGNPFEFDYAKYARRNNFFHQQFLPAKDVLILGRARAADATFTEAAHEWCLSILQTYIKDSRALGLVESMLVGDEANLDPELRQAFTETGIVHVIAISGGNIAFLFMVVLLLLRWLRHKKYLWIKYLIALPLVWFYVLMAGGSPSAVRAALMFSLLAISFAWQKRPDGNSLNQLLATAFILLVARPMWLHAIGFQLSFAAVLSILLFYKYIFRWYVPANWILRKLWGAAAASIAAEILVAPLVLFYFHSFPLWFIISNVLAYVLMGALLLLGIAIILLSFIPLAAKAIGILAVWLVKLFVHILDLLRSLEPDAMHRLRLEQLSLLLLYSLIIAVAIYLLRKERRAAVVALGLACLLLVDFCRNRYVDLKQHRLVVYNIGKAIHIEEIRGGSFSVIASDTTNAARKDLISRQAHIGWQAFRQEEPDGDLVKAGGKTALVLKSRMEGNASLERVDYVVLAYPASTRDVKKINAGFQPAGLVLGYSVPDEQLSNWKTICANEGISLHSMEDGAFVLE